MPYIKGFGKRQSIDLRMGSAMEFILTEGDLNFAITRLLVQYIKARGVLNYSRVNEVVGALECAKQEFYRRVAAPYEVDKCVLNGDVYDDLYDQREAPEPVTSDWNQDSEEF